MEATLSLPYRTDPERPELRWFSPVGGVAVYSDRREVFVGGALLGTFGSKDRPLRNLLLVQLAEDAQTHMGNLASAFGVSVETVRLLRRLATEHGLAAVVSRSPGGSDPKVTPAMRRRAWRWFGHGLGPSATHRKLGEKVGLSTVRRLHAQWRSEQKIATTTRGQTEIPRPETAEPPTEDQEPSPAVVEEDVVAHQGDDLDAGNATGTADDAGTAVAIETEVLDEDQPSPIDPEVREVESARFVQHLGTWLMVATVHAAGLHAAIGRLWPGHRGARLATDAFVMALALQQNCVEGVRRLQTATAGHLLRAAGAPSASWIRRTWKQMVEKVEGWKLHFTLAGHYLREAMSRVMGQPVVFYVDNHLRRYTGKHVLRKGWRMQDKRAVPGATDYWVHDDTGRPMMRIDVPQHGSLTEFLTPIAGLLRMALGKKARILLAFDRAGAFPAQMAELRDEDFEFVTYERRPYPLLSKTVFKRQVTIDGETFGLYEHRLANLGRGRGRVRRIVVLTPEGKQVNLLAVSTLPAERLLEIMKSRWNQENGFKHQAERWGINQLDRRKVDPYPTGTIIPNPAWSRLERELRLARAAEGTARSTLARLAEDDPARTKTERALAEALAAQERLQALRPQTPRHAPVESTPLAGKLVRHTSPYKTALDTIRVACANAESELAYELSRHLPKPAEAKRHLANLLAAPGDIEVKSHLVRVVLRPAGTARERMAFARLCDAVNAARMTLPGDRHARRLHFDVQV
jgi:hypothetical protein